MRLVFKPPVSSHLPLLPKPPQQSPGITVSLHTKGLLIVYTPHSPTSSGKARTEHRLSWAAGERGRRGWTPAGAAVMPTPFLLPRVRASSPHVACHSNRLLSSPATGLATTHWFFFQKKHFLRKQTLLR
jgi:hypothetical protein